MTNSYIYSKPTQLYPHPRRLLALSHPLPLAPLGRPIPLRCNGLICPSRSQLLMHSILSIFMHDRLNLSHEHVRRAPENVRSGSDDSAGIDRIDIAILLNRG